MNRPPLRIRILISLGAGLVAALLLWFRFRAGGAYLWALDFTPYWRAADAFRRGYSPYQVINAWSKAYPCCNSGYVYMFPATIFFLPFAWLPAQLGAVLAEGIYVAVFAFALTKDGYWRLPLLLSYPLIFCALSGQVVPLMTAAFLLPSLGLLASIKFTHGAVGFVYNLSRRYFIGAAVVVLASIAIWPWWPAQFWAERHDVAGVYYHIPVLLPGGFLILAALYRWRRPEARLVAAMACIPQAMIYYDQLPLGLIALSYRECLAAAMVSWLAPAAAILVHGTGPVDREMLFGETAPLILIFYYLPATLLVLLRKPPQTAEHPNATGR